MSGKGTTYRLSKEWAIKQQGASLLVTGGADVRYEIELENNQDSFFPKLNYIKVFTRKSLSEPDQRILEQLVSAEVVLPTLQKTKQLKIKVLGDENKIVLNNTKISVVKTVEEANIAIIIRTNSTYADLLHNITYETITIPHLFIDLAFHHTFSLGPLVFPGETACVACLQGRISTRWGDELPPEAPGITNSYIRVVTEIIAAEITRIAAGDTSLTNKTISWNFQNRTTRTDQLLKVPLCPVCMQNKIDHSGALALPW